MPWSLIENAIHPNTDALLKLGDTEGAIEAIKTAECMYVNTFAVQLVRGVLNLDELSGALGTARFTLLRRIALMKGVNPKLAVDMAIRWKCIFSQFRSVLIHKGLGNSFLSTFLVIENALTTGSLQGLSSSTTLKANIAKAHEKMESEFLRKYAFTCFRATIEISTSFPIECILESDEMVIDFVTLGDFNDKLERVLSIYAVVVMPDGERLIEEIDCSAIMNGRWIEQLNKSTADITTDIDKALQLQLEESGKELCSTLFPPSIMKCILKPEVKHIYIGSSLLSPLPFVLLPGPNNSPLFKNCTVSCVNSASELLQQVISVRLLALEKEHQQHEQTSPQDDQIEPWKQSEPQSPTFQQPSAQASKSSVPQDGQVEPSKLSEPQSPILQQPVQVSQSSGTQDDQVEPSKQSEPQSLTLQRPPAQVYKSFGPQDGQVEPSKQSEPQSPILQQPVQASQPSGTQDGQTEPSEQSELTLQQPATQVPKYSCEKTLSNSTECYIFADPNYDLQIPQSGVSLWEALANLWKPTVPKVKRLPNSLSEASEVASILAPHPEFKVHVVAGDAATVTGLMKLESPFILHISTHGYMNDADISVRFRRNLWDNTASGLVMAGYNTFHEQKYSQISPEAGTGMLNSLGATGLKLTDTRLVFLSLCKSGLGPQKLQEASSSLADAFRAAGARTVIASLWAVADEPTAELVKHFYTHALVPGIRPSKALENACEHVRSNPLYCHWYNWAGFTCYGMDLPIFPIVK